MEVVRMRRAEAWNLPACLRPRRRVLRMREGNAAYGRELLVEHEVDRKIRRRSQIALPLFPFQIRHYQSLCGQLLIRDATGLDDDQPFKTRYTDRKSTRLNSSHRCIS